MKEQAINSGRKICKESIFALVDRLPAAKMPAAPPRRSPAPIERRGAAAPDTPGKSVWDFTPHRREAVVWPIRRILKNAAAIASRRSLANII